MKRVLVFGYSKVAKEIVTFLEKAEIEFVMASSSLNGIEAGKKNNHQVFYMDYNKDEELKKFGIGDIVETLFCLSNDFNKNLFLTLSARNIDKNLKIISLVSNSQEESKMKLAGASKIIDPYSIGANYFFTLMKKERVHSVIEDLLYESSNILLEELKVTKKSKFLNEQFSSANFEKNYNLLVLGMYDAKREKFKYNIQKISRKIKENDILVVMGNKKEIERLKKEAL